MSDSTNDKPFACNEKGCEMKFSNVDHLSVHQTLHQKKREMKLKFSSTSSVHNIADQTPTPSRFLGNFLQNWEEVGLNHEIQEIKDLTPIPDNNNKRINNSCKTKSSSIGEDPFSAAFSNALKSNNNVLKTPDLLSRVITDSPLNTPSLFPCNEGLMAIANAALNTPYPEYSSQLMTPEVHNDNQNTTDSNAIGIDHSLSSQSSNSSFIETTTASVSVNESSDTSCNKSVEQQYQTNGNVVKPQKFQTVSVICSANTNFINSAVSQTIPNILISQPINKLKSSANLRAVPIAQTSKNTAIIAPKTKESSITIGNANALYKVILKLPDGRSVQLPLVQQPITNTTTTSIVSSAQTITSITNSSKNNFNISNNEAIHLANKISIGATGSSSSQLNQTSGASFTALQSKVEQTLASLPPKAKPGRKSKFAPEEDPKEKKARSLERNRAAAMRCRLKRKHWIDSLEEKADEYEKINEKLQNEVVALRREVTLLKTALLAHKDCPVTLQQQKVTNADSNTSVTIITTNGDSHYNGLNNNSETNGNT